MRAAVLLVVFMSSGCLDLEPRGTFCASGDGAGKPGATWHDDVAPLMARKCMSCHREGGNAPMSLDTYAAVSELKASVRDAVETRRMPPWPPAPCCGEFQNPASLTADERALLLGWIDDGVVEGNVQPAPVVPARPTLDADVTLTMPEEYTPVATVNSEDTRCFLLETGFTETRYVTGIDIKPGVREQMHHSLVLTVAESDLKKLQDLDAQTAEPGWSCPGGILGSIKSGLGGSFFEPQTFDGRGFRVDPTDRVVLTMHYSLPAKSGFKADRTSVQLRTQTAPVTPIVTLSIYNPGWLVGGMPIAPDASSTRFSYADSPGRIAGGASFDLHAVNLHMHERGKKGGVWILRANGTQECLLQIDAWNHGWQGDYRLAKAIRLGPQDRLLVDCEFDNTVVTQRIIDGVKQKPRWLNWGEDQEMCVGFVTATRVE
ncbi:MAG: hypothetical protein U0228_11375 [Myxococcaceae bacterium]